MTRIIAFLAVALFLLLPNQASSQEDPPRPELSLDTGSFSGLPLDLLPPGARALALGGAFAGVADDATAALANPAGLTNLSSPEVSVFLRHSDADLHYLDPDAYNSGRQGYAGQLNKTYSDSATNVSFASFVLPLDRIVFSGFYSSQADFSGDPSQPDEVFDDIVRVDPTLPDYPYAFFDLYTNSNSLSATVENLGLSAAFRLTDQFSVGLTLKNGKLDLRSADLWQVDWWNDLEREFADDFYGADDPEGLASLEEIESYLPFVTDVYTYQTNIDDSDKDLTFDLGFHFKGEMWSFGLVYHEGAKFKLDTVGIISGNYACTGDPNDPRFDLCNGLEAFFAANPEALSAAYPNLTSLEQTVISLPDITTLGTAFRPADTWLLSFDVNWINYSILTAPRSVTLGFGLDINDVAARTQTPEIFYDPGIRALTTPLTEPIKDSTTFNFGAEKSFVFESGVLRTLALRGGAFTVQDHDGIVATDNDEVVITLGVGSTWGRYGIGEKVFQVDLGASFADDVTNVVLSGIFRF